MKSSQIKARAVKPTKGWAIVNPDGKIEMASLVSKTILWGHAFNLYGEYHDASVSLFKRRMTKHGYRCIRVQILPLS